MDMELPDFCDYAGPALTIEPPFQFTDVTTAVFPLRANLDTLQRFVDGYINIVPEEVGHFRVALPFVHLMLLDYGKLADPSTNLGCFSQREMMFSIPLEWYQKVDGRYVFRDWATTAPFIYVDGQISLSVGRTAMGWAKSIIKVAPNLSGWLQDPSGMTADLAVSAQVFSESYQDTRTRERPVVVIRSQRAGLSWPLDPAGPISPWSIGMKWTRSMNELARGSVHMLRAAGLWSDTATNTPENAGLKRQKLFGMWGQVSPWAPNITFNSINLKQFRCADQPQFSCYQGLTFGPLTYTSLRGGGVLGNQWADISGDYVVDLGRYPTFPVVEALGLEPDATARDGDSDVVRVRPVMPFWYRVNMQYGATKTLAVRGRDGRWGKQGRGRDVYYNTSIGAASPVVTGPFSFRNATMHVCLLAADRLKLQSYVDAFLNTPLGEPGKYQVGAEHVLLMLADWGLARSETNSIGDWADLTLTFYIPIKNAEHSGLLPAYSYAGGSIHTQTLSELYGVPATEAVFVRPRGGPTARLSTILELKVEALPALHEGQTVRTQPLTALRGRTELTLDGKKLSPDVNYAKVAQKKTELEEIIGEYMTVVSGLDKPRVRKLEVYTLKQFRDANQSAKACYQAIVRFAYEVHESSATLSPALIDSSALSEEPVPWGELVIYQSAMHPIRDKLGLIANDFKEQAGAHPHHAAERFEITQWCTFNTDVVLMNNGEELCERTAKRWQTPQPAAQPTVLLGTRKA